MKKGPFLKLYTSYIMDFESKTAALEDARKKYYEFDRCTSFFEVINSSDRFLKKYNMYVI